MLILFSVLMIIVFGKLIVWSIKAAWGITKVIVTVVLFPLFLIGIFCTGAIYLAYIFLVICGLVTFIGSAVA